MKKILALSALILSGEASALDCSGFSAKEVAEHDFVYVGTLKEKTEQLDKKSDLVFLKNTMVAESILKGQPDSYVVMTYKPQSDGNHIYDMGYDYSASRQIEVGEKYLISGNINEEVVLGFCGEDVINMNLSWFVDDVIAELNSQ